MMPTANDPAPRPKESKMLESFRNASQSWFIKILFGFLIVSFGVWGVGDVIRQRVASTPAISVGDQTFSGEEVAERFRRDVDRMSAMFGSKLTLEQARQFGLLQRTVQQMVDAALLDQAAERLQLGVDEQTLRRTIAEIPAFQSQLKLFDKTTYRRVLASMNLNEKQFIHLESGDLARAQLVRMITDGVVAPADLTAALYRYHGEKRVAEYVVFAADQMPAPPPPDDATLQKFYDDHKPQFQQPELRAATILAVHGADLAATLQPSQADIDQAYQARLGEFQTPEKRTIEQCLFADQSKAQSFLDSVKAGTDFAAAARQAGTAVSDLGTLAKNEMPISELADAAFALPAPGLAGPVQSPLGWHALRIDKIVPGTTRALAEVKDGIVAALVKDETTNRLYSLSTKLEDSIGGGTSIADTAQAMGLKAVTLAAIDDHGRDADGKPISGAAVTPAILATLFQTVQGGTSDVIALPDNDGYYVLHVDKVTPALIRPLDQVRAQASAAWQVAQRSAAAKASADAAAPRIAQGATMASLAGPLKVETSRPFPRTGSAQVPAQLAAEMFHQSAVSGVAVVAVGADYWVARLKEIQRPDAVGAGFDAARQELSRSLADDLLQQYLAALKLEIGSQVNLAVIEQQFAK